MLIAAALPAAASPSAQTETTVHVEVDSDGRFTIQAEAFQWTFSGELGQPPDEISRIDDADRVGNYTEIILRYTLDGVPREASIRTYGSKGVVLFSERFPAGGKNARHFPRLDTYPRGLNPFGFGTWEYSFTAEGIEPGSPWLFFDSDRHSFLLSPASNFIVAGVARKNGALEPSLAAGITDLPAGFVHSTALVIGNGINATFDLWGHLLSDLAGKTRPPNDADVTLERAGHWTDNGSPYYYDPGEDGAKLLAVVSENAGRGIRLGYLQADSWWYLKGNPPSWRKNGTGTYRLRTDPLLFPGGLASFHARLGLPLVVHSRFWHEESPDRREHTFSGNVPIGLHYWRGLASYLSESGVAVFEQDWLSGPAVTESSLDAPEAFFGNMAQAMAEKGITIQYSMPKARHFQQASKYSNVTSIRVSPDGFCRDRWNVFLFTSRLAAAVGVWPFTDNFRSPDTESVLLAALSAGPFGPSDKLGTEHVENLRRVLRRDGVVVKPDFPLVPTDDTYIAMAERRAAPIVASTYTDFGGLRAAYVFAYEPGEGGFSQAVFRPDSLGIPAASFPRSYIYDYFAGQGTVVDTWADFSAMVGSRGSYFVVVPVGRSGMAFLGDTAKFVTLGKKRVSSLEDDGAITATIEFADDEPGVTVYVYSPFPPAVTAEEGEARLVGEPDGNLYKIRVLPEPGPVTLRIGRAEENP